MEFGESLPSRSPGLSNKVDDGGGSGVRELTVFSNGRVEQEIEGEEVEGE